MSVDPTFAKQWHAMSRNPEPRNVSAIRAAREAGKLVERDLICVSFVGGIGRPEPTVFVDSGRRYDMRCAALLFALVFVRPGIDARDVIGDLQLVSLPYVTLIDAERQMVASVVDDSGGAWKLWPRLRGGEEWRKFFG